MQVQDWLDAGYKRFEEVKHIKQYAEFGLQKCIRDEKGKQYYITVYVYDFSHWGDYKYSFVADCQFQEFDGKNTITLEIGTTKDSTVEEIEQACSKMWKAVGMPYYEEY